MPQIDVTDWLQFAIQQMAAESYLQGLSSSNTLEIIRRLKLGNNSNLTLDPDQNPLLPGNTRLTTIQAQQFVERYQIVDHHANDATGFSATLMRDTTTGEYTLSFRSTEYKNQIDGGDYERDGANLPFLEGADGEIVTDGFAFGQLAAMEHYYQTTVMSLLPAGAVLNVTGYSLGAHLATVFTELHGFDTSASFSFGHTYTFNGPGRGEFSGGQQEETVEAARIRAMITRLTEVLTNPMSGIPQGTPEELWPPGLNSALLAWQLDSTWDPWASGFTSSVYADARYLWAKQVVEEEFSPVSRSLSDIPRTDGAFSLITQIVSHATQGDTEYVANSGNHAPENRVYIEDQPDLDGFGGFFGASGDFGTTHSITLIVDSLATQELFQTITPALAQSDIEAIFAASSNHRASGFVGTSGVAEGNSLENALDALGKLFVSNYIPTQFGRQTGGFGSLTFRTPFYANLVAVKAALAGATVTIEPFVEMGVVDGQPKALPRLTPNDVVSEAQQDTVRGMAFRYALRALNPFAVIGADYSGLGHAANGQLALFDPATGFGEMTQQYLIDRAAFLEAKIELGLLNQEKSTDTVHFRDVASNYEITTTALFEVDNRQFLFGGKDSDTLQGEGLDDHLYGGDGHDVLIGQSGADYLEGNQGNDILAGGADNDELSGGAGFDTYIYNSGDGTDRIEDAYGQNAIIFDQQLLQGGIRQADGNSYTSLDGRFTYVQSGGDLIVNGSLILNDNFQNGEFGIRLVDLPSYDNGLPERTVFTKEVSNPAPPPTTLTVNFFDDLANDSRLLEAQIDTDDFNNVLHALGGNDVIVSGGGNDQLYGDGGNDEIYGGLGHDRVSGGSGDDQLLGDNIAVSTSGGNDYLDGGDGNDFVQGGGGRDIVLGGAGNDSLNGDEFAGDNSGAFDDFLDGGSGDDFVHGGAGSDVLIGGDGNDQLIGDATQFQNGTPEAGGNDTLDGGAGDDQLFGVYGDDVLSGGIGHDLVNGQDGSDVLYGGDGNDTLSGDLRIVALGGGYDTREFRAAGGEDLLFGEAGQDVLTGGEGNDVLNGGTENDFLFGDYITGRISTSDPLYWTLFTVEGDDQLQGEAGNDVLHGGFGADILLAGDGNDTLIGGAGDDVLEGAADDDILYGEYALNSPEFLSNPFISNIRSLTGNDILDGGAGQDELHGGRGDDTLLGGAGNDQLIDDEPGSGAVGGNDMLDGGDGNDILQSWWGDDVLHGGAGDDRLSSLYGHDVLYGDEGNDWLSSGFETEGQGIPDTTLLGGLGDDTYWIDGPGDVVVEEDGGGLDTVASFISYTLPDFVENLTLWGTVGIGNGLDNVMKILPGGGRLEGLDGDDDLSGYVGDDTLVGGAGNDQLFGDVGNDRLIGGDGNDIYLINLADGVDMIEDVALGAEGNRIRFGDWILQSDLAFVQGSNTLDIYIGNRGGVVRLLNFDPTGASGSLVVETLAFADGSTMNLADLFPPNVNHAPTVANLLVDQTVPEDAPFSVVVPANTFADQDAGDVLTLSASLADGTDLPSWLTFDATTATFSGTPDDAQVGTLDLKVTATDQDNLNVSDMFTLTVNNVNEAPTVAAPLANQTAVEDTAFSFAVPGSTFADEDQVQGDQLTYSATLADGSVLPTWLSFDSVTRTLSGTPLNEDVGTLALTVTATDQGNLHASADFSLTVQNVNDAPVVAAPIADQTAAEDSAFTLTIPGATFTDEDLINGDVLTYQATLAGGNPLPTWLSFNPTTRTFSGTPGAGDAGTLQIAVSATDTGTLSVTDTFALVISGPLPKSLVGTSGNDVLTGGRGDDTLSGLAGNDSLIGGAGNDLLDGGTGSDTIVGGTGNDTYVVDVAGDVVTELANEGTDTVQSSITYTLGANVENLTLTGTANLNGTGNALDNMLTGNGGTNVLTGGAGNDTYIVGAGDTVVENLNGGTDTVVSSVAWTLGSNVENLTLTGTAALNGTGNVLNNVLVGNSGANTLDGGVGNDTVDGGDGNDSLLGGSGDDTLLGSLGSDTLNAGSGNDVLNGGDGIDTLDGGSGDDQLLGGAGNDVLTGGSGADQFTGGTGNDTMTGGSGNDLYNFSRGDGQDTIVDTDPFPGNQDRAIFGVTINPLDLVISRQANDLRVTIHGSSDQITVQNWYGGTSNQVETLQAGNGQILVNTQVNQLIQAMASFSQQTGLTWDQAIDQRPQDVQTVLAASWH